MSEPPPGRPCETVGVFDERLAAAAKRVLAGDESMAAASDLERVVLDDHPGDERLEDLHEALALYSPFDGSPYVDAEGLRRAIQDALNRMGD